MSKSTKKGNCKNCCEGMGNINYFTKELSWNEEAEDYVYVWSCNNCGHETPVRKSPTRNGLTPSQEKEIARIEAAYTDKHSKCKVTVSDQFDGGQAFVSIDHDGHILLTMDYPSCATIGVRGKTEYHTGKEVYFR